jgi:hypothetical protein
MSKLPTKLIVMIVAAGIIAATMTTREATKVFNLATANVAPGTVRLGVEALQNSATVPAGQAAEAIINCPSNFPFPTGGGYDTDGAVALDVNYNGPNPLPSVSPTPTGWVVEAFNADPNHQERSITAYVICAKTTP